MTDSLKDDAFARAEALLAAKRYRESLSLVGKLCALDARRAEQVRSRAVGGLVKQADQEWRACRFDDAIRFFEMIPLEMHDSGIRITLVKCQNLRRLQGEVLAYLQEGPFGRNDEHVAARVAGYLAELALDGLRDDRVQSLFGMFQSGSAKIKRRAKVYKTVNKSLFIVGSTAVAIALLIGAGGAIAWALSAHRARVDLRVAIASKQWNRALSLDATNVEALLGRARDEVASVSADWDAALKDIGVAEQNGGAPEEVRRLRSLALARRALEAARSERIDEAEAGLAKAERAGADEKDIAEVNEAIALAWLGRAERAAQKQDRDELKLACAAAKKSPRTIRKIQDLWGSQAQSCIERIDLAGFAEACHEAAENGLPVAEVASLWLAFGATALERRNCEALDAAIEAALKASADEPDLRPLRAGSAVLRSLALARAGQMSEAADALLDAVAINPSTAEAMLAARDLVSLRVKVIAVCQSRVAAFIEEGKIQEAIQVIDVARPLAPGASEWIVQALTLDRLKSLSPEVVKSLPPATLDAAIAALPATAEIMLPPLVNSIGMEMRLLHAGTFVTGVAQGQSDEVRHQVTLTKRFYLGVHEVTNAQWMRVMGKVPSKWTEDDLPVEQVTWIEAVEFCEKLSSLSEERMRGRVYRLPTEAEWEYACRAGTTARRSFGDDRSKDLGQHAWCGENAGGRTHPVGQKLPNPWGLFDMYGNVWEWCSDWYGDLTEGAVTDPKGPALGAIRVFRGGSWGSNADRCQSSNRDGYDPSHRQSHLGFRVALDFRQPEDSELAE